MDPVNVLAKFETRCLPRSRDNMGTQKTCAVPGYAPAPFPRKFLISFRSDGLESILAKFEVRSLPRSRDNRGYPKKNCQSLEWATLP